MEKDKIYTIDDIARELGVSKTTVSRAISGKGRISKETRERVFAFIEEHDYRPNVVARACAEQNIQSGACAPGGLFSDGFSVF